jgi:hypothetical protein
MLARQSIRDVSKATFRGNPKRKRGIGPRLRSLKLRISMFRSEKGLEIPRLSKPEAQVKDDSSAMPASSFACASGLNTWGFCLPSSQVCNFQTCDSGFYGRIVDLRQLELTNQKSLFRYAPDRGECGNCRARRFLFATASCQNSPRRRSRRHDGFRSLGELTGADRFETTLWSAKFLRIYRR